MNAQKGVLTAPTTNGQTNTVNLPAGFALKAVIFFAAYNTAEGAVDGDGILSYGFATNDSGSIEQGYLTAFDDDANTSSDTARGMNTTAALKGFSAATPTVDYEMDVTTFSAEQFICTWTDAPASAIKIHYLALGGPDIERARVLSFAQSVAAATQDVTVAAGFGKPDLMLFAAHATTTLTDTTQAHILLGVGSDAANRCSVLRMQDAAANMDLGSYQAARCMVVLGGVGTIDSEATITADRAQWPTDGFELSYSDQSSAAQQVICLALKGAFTKTLAAQTVPTSGGLPVNQDLAHGFPPKAALVWGTPLPTGAAPDTSHADLGGFMIGATDGTNEGCCGLTEDDAAAAALASRWHSESKAIQERTLGATAVLQSEADGSFVGDAVRLAWNDIDSVAREYNYLLLGDATLPPNQQLVVPQAVQRAAVR